MLKIIYIQLLLIFPLWAQSLKVAEVNQLTNLDQGAYFFPQIGPGGDKVYFTGANFVGLFELTLESKKIVQLTADAGAGYLPVLSSDGQSVFYRSYDYQGPKRYSSLLRFDLPTGRRVVLEEDQRELSTPQKLPSGRIVYIQKNQLKEATRSDLIQADDSREVYPAVYIENRKMALYRGNEKTILEPLGEGIYIWPSISPDGQYILFTYAGKSTYISDLSGNIITALGRANAPQWSPDGTWIVYMDDKDDGHVYTQSEISLIKSDGSEKIQLTNSADIIEMYPNWGINNNTIIYASDRGEIFLMKLE